MPKEFKIDPAKSKRPTLALTNNPGIHKIQLTTWNIQRINPRKCLESGATIKKHLSTITDPSKPFFIAILENKAEPEAVEKLLREFPSLDATQKNLKTGHIAMGGSTYTQENLVWVAGAGLKVLKAEEWTAWHDIFNEKVNADLASLQKRYKALLPPDPRESQGRVVRDATRKASIEQFNAMEHPQASHFRNPVLLTLKQDNTPEQLTALIVHAPGPGGKELAMPTYAISYMNAVFEAAFKAGICLVQGDMNFHGEQEFDGYRRLGANGGPTTLTASGEGGSHMDRAYVLSSKPDATMTVNGQYIHVGVSDHCSVQTVLPVVDRVPVSPDTQMTDASGSSGDEEMYNTSDPPADE